MRRLAIFFFAALTLTAGNGGLALAGDIIERNQTAQSEADMAQVTVVEDDNDPLEGLNRGIFEFNRVVDGVLIKPVAQVYRGVLPQLVQDNIRSFLRNLRTPLIVTNDVLQGDMNRAGSTLGRFLVNTTVGILGLFDVASEIGLPFHDEDFGQTLAVWGVGEGFYLMLPILGPSNPRDLAGMATEFYVDPVNIYLRNEDLDYLIYTRAGLRGIDARARSIDVLDELERTSLDYYAAIRSLYRQQRDNEIRNSVSEPKAPSISNAEAVVPQDGASANQ